MASIHRDPRFPKGPFYCHLTLADGRRAVRSTGKRDRKSAEIVCQALQQAEDELAGGDLTRDRLSELFNETLKRLGESPVQRISVDGWLSDWLVSKERVCAPSTLAAYKHAIRKFLDFLGPQGAHRRLESIAEADVRAFVSSLHKEGRTPNTVKKLVTILCLPFTKALRLGKIRINPVFAIETERFEIVQRERFSAEQVLQLLAAAGRDSDWAGMVLFAWTTGARLGDCARLRWSSLDLEHSIVSFKQIKTGAESVVGLHEDFADWLTDRPSPEKGAEFVFPTLAGREINGKTGLSEEFTKLIEKAGIRNKLLRQGGNGKSRNFYAWSFHSFRHSAASQIFNQAALKEISRRVTGHTSSVVDRYLHKDLETIREATRLIPRLPKKDAA